jgi:nitrite reductase (NADH) large subunit
MRRAAVVISPLYKQRIRLRDGCQVENGEPAVRLAGQN